MKKNFAVSPILILSLAALAHSQAAAPAAAPAVARPQAAAPAAAPAVARPQAAAPAAAPSTCPAAPAKIGVIYAMNGIFATKEGQLAIAALDAKFKPKRDEVEKLDASIQANTDKLRKGATTMSADAQKKLSDSITADTKTLNRTKEDAQAEVDDEQGKITQTLGEKMMTIITKYGTDNCYSAILDVSNQQTPVLWYATGTDITADAIKLYDEKYPVAAAAAAPAGAPAAPAAKPPAAPAAPAGKKQP